MAYLRLTGSELAEVLQRVVDWWEGGPQARFAGWRERREFQPTQRLRSVTDLLCYASLDADLPRDVVEGVCAFLREAGDLGFPVTSAWPFLAKAEQVFDRDDVSDSPRHVTYLPLVTAAERIRFGLIMMRQGYGRPQRPSSSRMK